MTQEIKNMHVELKLFELYGLRQVLAAAQQQNIAVADFIPLAKAILPDSQARAFAARWPTLSAGERKKICVLIESTENQPEPHSSVK